MNSLNKTIYLLLAVLICLRVGPAAAHAVQPDPPAELKQFLTGALRAVRSRDASALAAASTGEPRAQYPWIYRPTNPGSGPPRQPEWEVGALQLPGDTSGDWYAVFYAVHPSQSTGDHLHRLERRGGSWKIGPEIPETETFGYRIRDHKITARFNLPQQSAQFTDTIEVQRTGEGGKPLQLRVSASFKVTSLQVEGTPLPFIQVGGVIHTEPPASLKQTGGRARLTLDYSGSVRGQRAFGNYIDPNEVVLTAYWYPVIARLPSTHQVTAEVPRGWTAVGQGDLIDRREGGSTLSFTYRSKIPVSYFTLDAGPYHIYEKRVGRMTYRVCLLKPQKEKAEKQLSMMDGSFRLFERVWGRYPFDHYTIVETQHREFAGALEAYSFTTYAPFIMPSQDPHEWAHTWWGGVVGCTYMQDIWNEAFATYSESLYARYGEYDPAPESVRQLVHWKRAFPGMDRQTMATALVETADCLYGPSGLIGYAKGGLVMQNLEETLGFETLMRCMREFRESHPAGEPATWADFERVVRRVAGRDYGWWFDQWVRRKGLPRLKWENVRSRTVGDGHEVTADLVQDGEPYRLSVPVWLETEGGETVRRVVKTDSARTTVTLRSAKTPARLLLDPQIRLPRAVSTEEGPFRRSGVEPLAVDPEASEGAVREASDADLREANVILRGGPEKNRVWARLLKHSPFEVREDGIFYKGRLYAGAGAGVYTPNPLNPQRWMLWEHASPGGMPSSLTSAVIWDRDGRILRAEEAAIRGGPGVFSFTPSAGRVSSR